MRLRRRTRKRVQVWQAPNGAWYFHVKNPNGRNTEPSQGYTRKSSAIKAAQRDAPGLPIETINGGTRVQAGADHDNNDW